jgi:hypothetical protein
MVKLERGGVGTEEKQKYFSCILVIAQKSEKIE